jgi:hypothetical protein
VLVGWNGLERKDGDVRDVGVLVTRYYLPGGLGRTVFRLVEGVPARYVPRKQKQQAEARSKTQTAWRGGGVGLGWEPEPEPERQSDRARVHRLDRGCAMCVPNSKPDVLDGMSCRVGRSGELSRRRRRRRVGRRVACTRRALHGGQFGLAKGGGPGLAGVDDGGGRQGM